MKYSYDKRQKLLSVIFWDYDLNITQLIDGIDNDTIPLSKKKHIFIRCVQKLPWHQVVGIWMFDSVKSLLTDDVINHSRIHNTNT